MSRSQSPTLAGFGAFVTNVMQIQAPDLPVDDPVINVAFCAAKDTASLWLARASSALYTQAVYNLAGDLLINFAVDQPGRTYFIELREALKINVWVPGVVGSSANASTSESLVTQEFMKNYTMSNLQNLKTEYGRRYLAMAQRYGSNLWGLT